MRYSLAVVGLLTLLLSGCAIVANTGSYAPTINLPLIPAWYDGRKYYYVSTDAWPRETAERMGVNYAPRLADAIPPRPKPPELNTVLERIYVFTNSDQPNVMPSAPDPVGPQSQNKPYSPLWQLYEITWLVAEEERSELKSESDVFTAESAGKISIAATEQVVNCPVVADAEGNLISGSYIP